MRRLSAGLINALAATAGVVFGFAWSGGGVPAVAETPVAAVAATTSGAPLMVSSGIGAAGTFADIVERISPAVVSSNANVSGGAEPENK